MEPCCFVEAVSSSNELFNASTNTHDVIVNESVDSSPYCADIDRQPVSKMRASCTMLSSSLEHCPSKHNGSPQSHIIASPVTTYLRSSCNSETDSLGSVNCRLRKDGHTHTDDPSERVCKGSPVGDGPTVVDGDLKVSYDELCFSHQSRVSSGLVEYLSTV
jgi:hypothetical protein